jgi:putrescine aminotransferase
MASPISHDVLNAKDFAAKALDLVHDTKPDADALTSSTLALWRAHVNAGFLTYRKSMGDGDAGAKVDWRDLGGCWVADAKGQPYLDCLSGFGVFNVGHSHPTVVQAVRAQLDKQALHSQEFLDPLRAYLAGLLARITPGHGTLSHSFFVNSGAEAVEAALKLAMLHTGRFRVLACLNGFHGKTLGALSTTSKALFRGPFVGALLDVVHVPFNDCDALRAAMEGASFTGNPFAACIVEPVQGEGGIHVATSAFLTLARDLCTATGTCLVLDEIQSGMGRTGRMFAVQELAPDVVPDLMCIGKSLSGGIVPIAAVCGTAALWTKCVESPFLFTTTFGGNPLACAAAIATIHVLLQEDLLAAAKARGEQLQAGLRLLTTQYPQVLKCVRGVGLLIGVECSSNTMGIAWSKALLAHKVIVSGTLISATTIRVCPPLVISEDEVTCALAAMKKACLECLK